MEPLTIKYCLVASDMNSTYYEFYPLVQEYWRKIGIETILILISDVIPEYLAPYKDSIILFSPIIGINTAFQAQCIRNLYPALLQTDKGVIISDMDLIPLNRAYYFDNIKNITDDKFVVYRNCLRGQYPMCFCLATPKIWRDIFKVNSVSDICEMLKAWYTKDYRISDSSSIGWATDQLKLFELVNRWNHNSSLILLNDWQTKHKRYDRGNMEEAKSIFGREYTDFHLPRPYSLYKEKIASLLK